MQWIIEVDGLVLVVVAVYLFIYRIVLFTIVSLDILFSGGFRGIMLLLLLGVGLEILASIFGGSLLLLVVAGVPLASFSIFPK